MPVPSRTEAPMSAEAFIARGEAQHEARHELLDGIAHRMSAERLIHVRTKTRVHAVFQRLIAEAGLACEAFGDGAAVRVDDSNVFEPDMLVRCGPRLDGDALLIEDPVLVLEVTSPSTQRIDAFVKFTRYFRNPHIVHYLVVAPTERLVVHHRRGADGQIVSSSHDEGSLRLEPPGLTLPIAALFAPADLGEA